MRGHTNVKNAQFMYGRAYAFSVGLRLAVLDIIAQTWSHVSNCFASCKFSNFFKIFNPLRLEIMWILFRNSVPYNRTPRLHFKGQTVTLFWAAIAASCENCVKHILVNTLCRRNAEFLMFIAVHIIALRFEVLVSATPLAYLTSRYFPSKWQPAVQHCAVHAYREFRILNCRILCSSVTVRERWACALSRRDGWEVNIEVDITEIRYEELTQIADS
jgi:hypothetical protein